MNVADDLQSRWWKLEEKLMERFGKKPDMECSKYFGMTFSYDIKSLRNAPKIKREST
jgi:hypothetical protein